jgi:hypothetical protein
MENVNEKQSIIKFNNQIDIGQIIMIVGLIATAITALHTVDKRLVILEENIKYQAYRDDEQDTKISETEKLSKDIFKDVIARIDKMKDMMGQIDRSRK